MNERGREGIGCLCKVLPGCNLPRHWSLVKNGVTPPPANAGSNRSPKPFRPPKSHGPGDAISSWVCFCLALFRVCFRVSCFFGLFSRGGARSDPAGAARPAKIRGQAQDAGAAHRRLLPDPQEQHQGGVKSASHASIVFQNRPRLIFRCFDSVRSQRSLARVFCRGGRCSSLVRNKNFYHVPCAAARGRSVGDKPLL